MHRFSLTAVAAATLLSTLAACGGGGTQDDERQAPLGREVTIEPGAPNLVSQWGQIAFQTAGNLGNQDVATTYLAMYDAAMGIVGSHRPYAVTPSLSGAGAGDVGLRAAITEAAYRTLKGLFPSGGSNYEAPYADGLAALPDGDAKSRGMAIGAEVAAGLLALRANDGRDTVLAPYVAGTGPGEFRGPNPVNRVAPYIRPFTTKSHAQFRAPGPHALTSDEYAADLNEVQRIAGTGSAVRTAAQTETARFHTENPNLFWNRNLRQFIDAGDDLADSARVGAMLWTVYQDAANGCFESKYHYNFWRPVSAINFADTDGNPATTSDPAWTPHVPTPNHPEYPAAHGCVSGSLMETLRTIYGTKKVHFDFTSGVPGTVVHHFDSTDRFVHEIWDARVWGGMHFRSSVEDGSELGKSVAQWMTKHYFQPVSK
jgi:hypothetical protein